MNVTFQFTPQIIHYILDGMFTLVAAYMAYRTHQAKLAREEAEKDKREALSEETQQYNQARAALDVARQKYDDGNRIRLEKVEGDLASCQRECAVQLNEGRARELQQMRDNADLRERLGHVEGLYRGLLKIPVSEIGPLVINPAKPDDDNAGSQLAVT